MLADTLRDRSFLICRIGARLCGLRLGCVSETMRPLPLELLQGTKPFVLGVSVIRGNTVPVVDAGLLIGAGPSNPGRFVSINTGGRLVALAVDTVLGIQTVGNKRRHHR